MDLKMQALERTYPSDWKKNIGRLTAMLLAPLCALLTLAGILGLAQVEPTAALGVIRYVVPGGTGDCSQVSPCALQTAVNASTDDDEVRVSAGTYFTGSVVLSVTKTITVVGGYDSSNWSAEPNPQLNASILDGQNSKQVIRIEGVVSPTIQGFVIENGRFETGAGIFNQSGGATILNNVIRNNNAVGAGGAGGGIYDSGSAIVENNIIHNNSASQAGGGIFINNAASNGNTTIRFNQIYSNSTTSLGGGILMQFSNRAFIEGNEIYNNQAADSGGGFITFGHPTISTTLQNNFFYNNSADDTGGGLLLTGKVDLFNNTIAGNSANSNGGGLSIDAGATVQISNTIVVSNTGGGVNGIRVVGSGVALGDYNNIFGNSSDVAFTNQINSDPQFINFDTFNLHLLSGSPNEDAGDPNTSASINIDIDGQVRPRGVRVDIGADEIYPNVADFALTPPTGSQTVDRGSSGTFTHTLENVGTVADSYSFTCANSRGWTVTCPGNVNDLGIGNLTDIQTIVDVPAGESGLTVGQTTVTATSVTSPTLVKTAVFDTIVAPIPNVAFTPNFTSTLLPGETVTFTHILTNTGDSFDTFSVTIVDDPGGWAEIVPVDPLSVPLASGASTGVRVRVTVPGFAPQGLPNVAQIQAASSFDPDISATVVNTVTARATVGTRYAAPTGSDEDNNCTQQGTPCATIERAIGQAARLDEVRISAGNYVENPLAVNDTIYISGGWINGFTQQDGPDATRITPSGNTRLLNIAAGSDKQPTIENMTLANGNGGSLGGAISVGNFAQPELTFLILENNQAGIGGALHVGSNSLLTISQTQFLSNTATDASGGGMFVNGGTVFLYESSFVNNESTAEDGGAVHMDNGFLSLTNSLFAQNSAGDDGGALSSNAGIVEAQFNTFVENDAGGDGGAIFNDTADLTINSSLIVSNTAVTQHGAVSDNSGSGSMSYSNLFANTPAPDNNVATTSNNISADPLFADSDYRLSNASPAIDAADPAAAVDADFEGDFRPSDQGFDIGYDEQPGCVAKRDSTIFGSIQAAIDMDGAVSDLILVSGVCRGVNTVIIGGETVSQTVHITETVTIQGGWNSDFTQQSADTPAVVDPEGEGRGIVIFGGAAVQPTIEMLTVTNGDATGLQGGVGDADAGGGIFNVDATVTLNGVTVMTNTAVLGGGIYNSNGIISMTGSLEDDGMLSELFGNSATEGGAVYIEDGTATLDGLLLRGNTATDGAGLYISGGVISATNSIFNGNSATQNGGGVYNGANTAVNLLHLTLYNNSATNSGGGFYNAAGSPIVRSNIFESNSAAGGGDALTVAGGTPDIDYNYYHDHTSPLDGTVAGPNDINDNATPPGLIDAAGGDFHLAEGAPAIDAGDPDSPILTDFENDPRPSNQSTDMGADEVAGCRVRLNGEIYGSIQTAIALAEAGDVIDVAGTCSGVHEYDSGIPATTGCLDNGLIQTTVHIDKDVILRGGWNEQFTNRNDITTLDALGLGHVIYVAAGTSPTIEQFDIVNGSATGAAPNGGGICIDSASPTIVNNRIMTNTAVSGAGIFSFESEPIIKGGNRIFTNTATANGGGIAFESLTGLTGTLQNNFIYDNVAVNGGAIYNDGGDNHLWHNTIVNNRATEGGAIYVQADNPQIRGNLVVSNTASSVAGGAFGAAGTAPTLSYNDFFDNGTNFGGTIADGGTGAVSVDPLFANEMYTLTITSPVVDIADPTIPITDDFEADIRPSHQGIDIGADEVGGCFAYIDGAPDTIYGSLQLAIDTATAGDTIFVDGTCYGVNDNGAVLQNSYIDKDLTIDGDWRSGLHASTNLTATLDALGEGLAVFVTAGNTVTLTNMTLTGGATAGDGGGLYNEGTLLLDTVSIEGNTAVNGGGIFNDNELTVQNSIIANNSATDGAGIFNNAGAVLIQEQTLFQENVATGNGGAVYQADGDLTLDASTLAQNEAAVGGAIYLSGGVANDINVTNNFIYDNEATIGGGIYNDDTAANLLHNTLYSNEASGGTGGGVASAVNTAVIRNNIIDLNTGSGIDAPAGTDINYNNVVNNTAGYSGGASAGGNDIAQTPQYVNSLGNDFHLQDDSPGVDVADPASPLTSDYDGDVRPTNQGPDMGADELNSCLIRVISPADASENIFGVVQDAIDYAESFAGAFALPEIEVARGECRGVQSRGGTEQVAYVQEDLTFVGSLRRSNFAFTGDYDSDTVGTVSSVFNAEGNGRVLVVTGTAEVSFTHISFIEGDGTQGSGDGNGGAVYINSTGLSSFVETSFCESAATNGAGIFVDTNGLLDLSGVRVGSCITAKVTEGNGGAVQNVEYTFHDGNLATNDGGGLYANGRFDLRNVSIYENVAGSDGGGLYNNGADNRLINATFFSNTAQTDGGGLYDAAGNNLGVYHNTFRDNTAVTGEGGAIWHNSASLTLNSTIIYSNTATSGGGLRSTLGNRSHNNFFANAPEDIAGGTVTDPNSQTVDPRLIGTFLTIDSPAIDAADPDLLTNGAAGTAPFVDGLVIDFDRSVDLRPDDVTENTGIHGIGSDIGSDEYRKGFGCLVVPTGNSAMAVPGQTVTYTFRMENQGRSLGNDFFTGYTDTLTLTLNSTQGWGLLEPINPQTVTLGFEESVTRTITVTVPATATTGLQDVSTLSCQSGSAPSSVRNGTATTSVGAIGGLIVEPDYTANVLPGDVITFEHTVTNLGNATGTFELNAASGPQHASAVLVNAAGAILTDTEVTLAPTESVTTLLRVTILDTGTAGDLATPGVIALDVDNPANFAASQNQLTIGAIAGTRYIAKAGAADSTNCTDPANPCATIQHALGQALTDDTILLSTGTYTESTTQIIGAATAEQSVYIDKSITIQGGYNVADGFTNYAPITNAVTIDGEGVRRAFLITDGLTVTLSSLFIENSTSAAQAFVPTRGGAVYNVGSNLTISGTWLLGNQAREGGALYHGGGDLTLVNSALADNRKPDGDGSLGLGGAVYLDGGSNDIVNNSFVGNSADNNGAEVGATGSGGAIYAATGSFDLINNIFDSNSADANERAVAIISPTVTINNDFNLYWSEAGLFDQINVVSGTNSFVGDPLFEDVFYHISANSAAKDAGTAVSITPPTDFEQDIRPNGVAVDIGADERQQRPALAFAPTPLTATIGTGETFTYTHVLTNTGDIDDSYTLTMTNTSIPAGGGFGYELTPLSTGLISPGGSITVTFVITGGLPGYQDVTEIVATAASLVTGTVQDTTSISQTAGVDIEADAAGVGFPGQAITYTHILTNTGDGVDQFNLAPITATAVPTGWLVTVDPMQTDFVQPGASIPFTVTVNVPVGTLSDTVHTIGIEATATDPFASDILTDTTTVGAAYGLTLTPDNERTVDSDTTAVYTHTLQNVGNLTDTVTLSFGSVPSWVVQVEPTVVTLLPLETQTVVVSVTVPADTGGVVHTATITATSEGALTATAVNTTTVNTSLGVLLEPDSLLIDDAGATVQHLHTITNTGNVTDTFDLTAQSSMGWLDNVAPASITLGAGLTGTVTTTVTIPALANPGESDVTVITATSQMTSTVFDTAVDTTRVRQIHGLAFAPDNTATVAADTTISYTHTLTNTGNASDTFTLTATSSQGWPIQLPTLPITLDSGLSSPVVVTLTVPAAGAGLTDTMTVTASSIISPAASAQVTNTTIVSGTPAILGVSIAPDNSGAGQAGETVTYTHTISNLGDTDDTYLLTLLSANGWASAVDPISVTVAALDSALVIVTTTIPGGSALGETDTLTVTATSATDGAVFDTATNTTTVGQPFGVIIAPNNETDVDAGTTVIYTHVVTNTGSGTDTFSFDITSSNDWPFTPVGDVTLGAGLTATIEIQLTVPAGASGLTDAMLVTAVSTGDNSVSDFATNVTNVNGDPATLGVVLSPDNAETVTAGATVRYIHTIENRGSTTDDFVITAVSSEGWAVTITPDNPRLTAGASTGVLVAIDVPAGAAGGTIDTTTVTATSLTDSSVNDSATNISTVDGGTVEPDPPTIYLPLIYNGESTPPPGTTPTPVPTATPTSTPPPTCSPTGVDLVVTQIRVEPATPQAGVPATVFVTILNQGSVDVTFGNNFFLDFYVDRVPGAVIAGDLAWGVQGSVMDAGASQTFSAPYTFSGGFHQLYAQVDTDNTVDECPREDNNVLGPVSLTVSGTSANDAPISAPNEGPRATPTPNGVGTAVPPQLTPIPTATPTAESAEE